MKKNESKKNDSKKREKEMVSVEKSKSQLIRDEFKSGLIVSEISKKHSLRYQFVYNVVSDYCLKNNVEMSKRNTEETKKDKIIELYELGKTTRQIMVELDTYPNYISRVITRYLSTK